MAKLLLFGTLVLFLQSYLSVDAYNIFLSKENANSFLQKKSRNRRSIKEGVFEECCWEDCVYEEKREFIEENEDNAFYDAVCELSSMEKKSCTCQTYGGTNYECGSYTCYGRACGCGGKKDSKQWEVINVSYDIARGSVNEQPVSANSKTVNNLDGETQAQVSFSFSTTVTEEESFTHTFGSELSVGATFSAGVPLVTEAEISTTLTVKSEHEFGKKTSKAVTRSATLTCSAPPHRYVVCDGIIKVKKLSVPYTMTLKNKHYGCTCTSKGIYKNVHHSSVYMKPSTYKSIPSGDEVEDVKLIEDRSQFMQDQSQLLEDQFVEDQSIKVN